MIRVLLVEDDPEIARIIRYDLAGRDYEVIWARNGAETEESSHDSFDIILMDVMLPDASGIELCAQLRIRHRCPIIFISCLDDNETIIRALEQGGDDYITKPFDPSVLQARISANLRRVRLEHETEPENRIECAFFALDAAQHAILKDGETIPLLPTEFKLLSYLMRHPNQCFPSGELYRYIWGRDSYGDNRTVMVHIHNLRKKLEPDMEHPRYIKCLWGKGYMFDAQPETGRE